MKTYMRWAVGICGAAVIAVGSSICTAIYMSIPQVPIVPLTSGLSGKWADIDRAFNRRVQNAFPLGSSEKAMSEVLRRQGFVRDDWTATAALPHEAIAVRREDNLVCHQAAYVYWRADNAGRLTSLRGIYGEEGCL